MHIEFDVPFQIGQQVWLLDKMRGRLREVTCSFCEGRKEITGANGKTARCPDCGGYGVKKEPGTFEWIVANGAGENDFRLFISAFVVKPSGGTTAGPLVGRALIAYDEFKGEIFDGGEEADYSVSLDDVFASLEEAKAECDRRNTKA